MGRLLEHRAKDNKYRLWSTISDQWVSDWLAEDKMKQELIAMAEYDYKLKAIETHMTFPAGYSNKDVVLKNDKPVNSWFRNDEGRELFYAWQEQAFKGDYYAAVDKKFKELTRSEPI